MPSAFNCRTERHRSDLCISGAAFNGRARKSFSRHSLKHLPGRVRPARPARCSALACDTSVMIRELTNVSGLNQTILTKHESITYEIPSIVMDVSAMFVATTTFLAPCPPGLNPFNCLVGANEPYIG